MDGQNRSKKLTATQIRDKIVRFCVYQERCHSEVREKLIRLGSSGSQAEELMMVLITEGFLNEERFARTFCRGRFKAKSWGRIRILRALETKGLTPNCIQAGLEEIEDEEYLATLRSILAAKYATLEEPNIYIGRDKVAKYAIQKGFEPDLVWEIIRATLPDR